MNLRFTQSISVFKTHGFDASDTVREFDVAGGVKETGDGVVVEDEGSGSEVPTEAVASNLYTVNELMAKSIAALFEIFIECVTFSSRPSW